jgi:hypothetical protein
MLLIHICRYLSTLAMRPPSKGPPIPLSTQPCVGFYILVAEPDMSLMS